MLDEMELMLPHAERMPCSVAHIYGRYAWEVPPIISRFGLPPGDEVYPVPSWNVAANPNR